MRSTCSTNQAGRGHEHCSTNPITGIGIALSISARSARGSGASSGQNSGELRLLILRQDNAFDKAHAGSVRRIQRPRSRA